MANLLEEFTADLNRHFFLKEFSFDKNKFRAACNSEFELADHVIALPDAMLVFQLKERASNASADVSAVCKWFRRKVLDVGCGQLADSLGFLRTQPHIVVQNQRGHSHDLATLRETIIPIIVYSSGPVLPSMVHARKHHVSRRAGFVHLIHIRDYYHLCRTLALPTELIGFFQFRETLLLANPEHHWHEEQIAAQFIADTDEPLGNDRVRTILQAAAGDITSFDITPILGRLGDKITYLIGSNDALDYYKILGEFTRMNRAQMRGVKELLTWTLEKAGGEQTEIPARMKSSTGTGFVFFPVPRHAFNLRLNALRNFATLMKYDFRLDRQIGVSVARDGEYVEISWLFMEHPWERDEAIEDALAANYPFREKPTPQVVYRYPTPSLEGGGG
jgi:hypothetical protein